MGFDDILKFVEENGVVGTLIAAFAFIIYILAQTGALTEFGKWIAKQFKKRKQEKSKSGEQIKVKESDILNHEIFNYIDFWLYSKIPTLTLKTEFRTAVFRRYLHLYFKSYKDVLHIFVNEGEYKTLDNSELRQKLLKLITDIVYEYEMSMRADKIPEIVIDKMKARNNDALNLTLDLINSICDSDFYNSDNNLLKVYSFLNIVLSILENTMAHCEDVSNSINGELVGLTYNGFVEPPSS